MTLEQVYYSLAIAVMICLLIFMVLLVVMLFQLYRSCRTLERTVVEKLNRAEYQLQNLQNKKNLFMGSIPALGTITSLLMKYFVKKK